MKPNHPDNTSLSQSVHTVHSLITICCDKVHLLNELVDVELLYVMEDVDNIFSKPGPRYDVTLIAEGKPLYMNKVVLSFASPVFDKMFQWDSRGRDAREIVLPDTSYDAALEFLLCIFPSTVKPVTKKNLELVLPLADVYQVQSLKDRCERFVMNLFKLEVPSNQQLLQYLCMAEKYGLTFLVADCVERACHRKFSGYNGLKNIREFSFISVETKYELVAKRLEMVDSDFEDNISLSTSYVSHGSLSTLTDSIHLERSIGGHTMSKCDKFNGLV